MDCNWFKLTLPAGQSEFDNGPIMIIWRSRGRVDSHLSPQSPTERSSCRVERVWDTVVSYRVGDLVKLSRPNHHPNYHPNSLTSCRVKKITIRKWDFVIILLSCSRFMNRVQKIRKELIKIKNSNSFRFFAENMKIHVEIQPFFQKSAKSHKW